MGVTKHGHTKYRQAPSPTYRSWYAMLQRCGNPRSAKYHNHGGRGIRACERWHTFENFLADMGERPDGMTLDRFPNNDGSYEPGNCRWATIREQNQNRRNCRLTPALVRQAIARVAGGESMRSVARSMGVYHSLISGIMSGKHWGNVMEDCTCPD